MLRSPLSLLVGLTYSVMSKASPLPSFSRNEVAKHHTAADLWVIIDGYVYDLTQFQALHPGGAPPLKRVAGKDATVDFYSIHRKNVLNDSRFLKLKVGTVQGFQATQATEPSTPFAESDFVRKHSPYYNASHRCFRSAVRLFVDAEIVPTCVEDDENGEDPSLVLNMKMGQVGILAAVCGKLSAKVGYSKIQCGDVSLEEFDYFHNLILCEEFKRFGAYGLSDGLLGGLSIGLPVILNFGSPYLLETVAKPCLRGEKRICLAISEPYAGSDVARIRCDAKLSEDRRHYIVNGVKKWITGGRFADFFTTLCKTEGGFALLVIEKTNAVSTKAIKTSYSSAAGTAYVEFNDALVPVENIVGEVGLGFSYTMYNFNHERWGMAVGGNRMSRLMLEESFKWAAGRQVFKRRLIDQPVIRFKMAQMAAEVESVHSMIEDITYQMCNMTSEEINKDLAGPIALLKYKQTRAASLVADTVCQIFGGRALTRSGMGVFVEKFQRSYKMQAILGGSEEILADLAIRQSMKTIGPIPAKL